MAFNVRKNWWTVKSSLFLKKLVGLGLVLLSIVLVYLSVVGSFLEGSVSSSTLFAIAGWLLVWVAWRIEK